MVEKEEFVRHPDRGCFRAKAEGYDGKCIDCPFPQCFEDLTEAYQMVNKKYQKRKDLPARNAEIKRLKKEGMTYMELAVKFGLGVKTIERVCCGK
jgi:DNA-binding NarL/FixJ family response regulator